MLFTKEEYKDRLKRVQKSMQEKGIELLISLRVQLAHLGAQVVGRQLTCNYKKPAKDESIEDLIKRLLQMNPLVL